MNQVKYQFRYAIPIWFVMIVFSFLPDNRISIRIRGYFVSLFLPGKPKGITLGRDVTLLGCDKLLIGDNVYFAKGVWINALGGVKISSEVLLAPYVVIASTKHTFLDGSFFKGKSQFEAITIGHGCWIAAHSTVISGVDLSDGTLVAANSVVTKSFEKRSILSGVPARKIGIVSE